MRSPVLVVCALALVVAAGAFLVIGLAAGDVGDLYLSMALCVASLVVVAFSARVSRPRPAKAASSPPDAMAPDDEDGAAEGPVADRGPADLTLVDDPSAPLEERLARVDAAEEAEVAARPGDGAAGDGDGAAGDGDAEIWAAPGAVLAPPRPVEAPARASEPEPDAPFPIADYDDLEAAQVLPLVPKLWPEEVAVVAGRERSTKARPAVLDALAEAAGDPSLGFPIAEYESLDAEAVAPLLDRLDTADLETVQLAERAGAARVGVLVAVADALAARR